MTEDSLAYQELKDIAASGALSSTSWPEVILKLSIAGIELTYVVFKTFLASMSNAISNDHAAMMQLNSFMN